MGALLEKYLITRFLSKYVKSLPKTLSEHIDLDELLRVTVTSFVTTQDVAAVLPALLAHVETIVIPEDVALVRSLLTVANEVVTRFVSSRQPQALSFPTVDVDAFFKP